MPLVAIKLGGSLITDKTTEATFRKEIATRISMEIQRARQQNPDLQILLGHGSGSFGHFEAKRYGTIDGVHTPEDWYGFTRVAAAAAQLNKLVTTTLLDAGMPVFPIQPSASAKVSNGRIDSMNLEAIESCFDQHIVPLVYGDVAFDRVRGGTIISTETIFDYLVANIKVDRVIMVGEVDGVYDGQGTVIPSITEQNFESIAPHLGQSRGVDVTGGMYAKVKDMLTIASNPPYPMIYILSGLVDDRLYLALTDQQVPMTRIYNTHYRKVTSL
jgi:isopentenyl phosphate kinase